MSPTSQENPPVKLPTQSDPLPTRLILLENIYYQAKNKQPITYGRPFTQLLSTELKPYHRDDLKADETWQQVEFMWVKSPGLIYLDNLEGQIVGKQPTAEWLAEVDKKIIEVAFTSQLEPPGLKRTMHSPTKQEIQNSIEPSLLVHPGQSIRIWLVPGRLMWIRSRHKQADYCLVAFPDK